MATSILFDDIKNSVKFIEPKDYSIITIKDSNHSAVIEEILPFRVKFTSIQIQDIRGMIPAIPLQVIGYSNYIL
jgi:hypothetical protein